MYICIFSHNSWALSHYDTSIHVYVYFLRLACEISLKHVNGHFVSSKLISHSIMAATYMCKCLFHLAVLRSLLQSVWHAHTLQYTHTTPDTHIHTHAHTTHTHMHTCPRTHTTYIQYILLVLTMVIHMLARISASAYV